MGGSKAAQRLSLAYLNRHASGKICQASRDMDYTRVTVFGGSGFLGSHIVKQLTGRATKVRIAARHPPDTGFPGPPGDGLITSVSADVRDEISVSQAVAGAEAVVNAVGLYVERGHATFDAVHVQGALNVAGQASRAGVARLLSIRPAAIGKLNAPFHQT